MISMKTTILALLALLVSIHVFAQTTSSNAPAPVPISTNQTPDAAITSLATAVNALRSNVNDLRASTDVLQRRVDRLEIGFLVLVVISVLSFIATCFLNAKRNTVSNRYREQFMDGPGVPRIK